MSASTYSVMTLSRTFYGAHERYLQAWDAGADLLRAGHRRVAITASGQILTVLTTTPQGGIMGTPAAMWSKP